MNHLVHGVNSLRVELGEAGLLHEMRADISKKSTRPRLFLESTWKQLNRHSSTAE